ncbi:Bax inhibitor-1/YccA family protein [Lapillicoccus sp.]|uniref:Bax inhibitor-1/YccA family protein n=1 Tax=Lapillicoccus sp. TaxID=1909287 RepID=UPI00326597C9
MAGNNPVFAQVNKQIQDGYAGFGQQRTGQPGAQPGGVQSGMQPGMFGAQDAVSQDQLENMYQQPPAGPIQTGRLTVDDVVMKTLGLFALVLVFAAGSWLVTRNSPGLLMPVWIGGMFVGLAIGLAIAFMKKVSVPLIVAYAVVEGVFVGAFSQFMERSYTGIVVTAVVATLCTFAGMLAGYRFGIIKVTSRSRRIFNMAIMGYLLFSMVNIVALLFGWTSGWGFGGNGIIGIGISLLGVGLAAYSLALDFDNIQHAVQAQLPEKYSWLLAHGLIVSLIWLYLEILRLLARMRN